AAPWRSRRRACVARRARVPLYWRRHFAFANFSPMGSLLRHPVDSFREAAKANVVSTIIGVPFTWARMLTLALRRYIPIALAFTLVRAAVLGLLAPVLVETPHVSRNK